MECRNFEFERIRFYAGCYFAYRIRGEDLLVWDLFCFYFFMARGQEAWRSFRSVYMFVPRLFALDL